MGLPSARPSSMSGPPETFADLKAVADQIPSMGGRKAARIVLVDGGDRRHRGDRADRRELSGLASVGKNLFELWVFFKMGARDPVVRARHEDDLPDAGANGLLDAVLDDRAIDEWKKLFREGFRGRQDSGAEAGRWKHDRSDRCRHAR